MAKLVYEEPEDYLVRVSICSILSFLSINPFQINVDVEKIQDILVNSTESNFIIFPEYTYSLVLEEIYQNFSNDNNCVIIGGSGLEQIGNKYYAYCPVFIPNSASIKVYKKYITAEETVLSAGKIIGYENDVQREIVLTIGDRDLSFSIYVCYDFLVENKDKRSDIIFVPQYEGSPEQFINEGDRISKGYRNFVIGCNNCNNNQRSIGFAILNSSLIDSLHLQHYRNSEYNDMNAKHLNQHHTIFYDINKERLISFDINIGRPYSLPFNYNLGNLKPVLIPINNQVL
ncbi:hypothetical protein [Flavobacterium sp.]|uniref:hypothetical protein n=1 Tax=Flavobacterium sp. TaxID=239 RepID=UPI002B4B09FB|nr:hypothetical protein [Flavobacterium sp.]HLF52555.1 hypothetical protein [Flavobacterium sp.]